MRRVRLWFVGEKYEVQITRANGTRLYVLKAEQSPSLQRVEELLENAIHNNWVAYAHLNVFPSILFRYPRVS